jgi:hypothetical protein
MIFHISKMIQMSRISACAAIGILVLILHFPIFAAHGDGVGQVTCPLLSKAVTIDGKWTGVDEWSDAAMATMIQMSSSSYNATAYLYTKHDESNYYFLIDFVSATSFTPSTDGAGISFDPLHNGGNTPQSDDRRFDTTSGGQMAIGTGTAWNWGNPLPSGVEIKISKTNSSNSAQLHQGSEFKIPFSIFPRLENPIGFVAVDWVGSGSSLRFVEWPLDYVGTFQTPLESLLFRPLQFQNFR